MVWHAGGFGYYAAMENIVAAVANTFECWQGGGGAEVLAI